MPKSSGIARCIVSVSSLIQVYHPLFVLYHGATCFTVFCIYLYFTLVNHYVAISGSTFTFCAVLNLFLGVGGGGVQFDWILK